MPSTSHEIQRGLPYAQSRIVSTSARERSGSHTTAAELTPVHDPDRPVAVSSGLAWRVPVYGGGILSVALYQAHLDGEAGQAECPVCAYDRRNQATHAIGLDQAEHAEESHEEAKS